MWNRTERHHEAHFGVAGAADSHTMVFWWFSVLLRGPSPLRRREVTDEALDLIIRRLNDGEIEGDTFIQFLSRNVYVGAVWTDFPTGQVVNEQADRMFFIKSEANGFVAAVLDMGPNDLHVYVVPEHRKKGYMAKALRSIILPYLLASERTHQGISFQSPETGRYAERVGFRPESATTALITREDLPSVDVPVPAQVELTAGRATAMKERTWKARSLLRMVRDELRTVGPCQLAMDLDEIANELTDLGFSIQDLKRRD